MAIVTVLAYARTRANYATQLKQMLDWRLRREELMKIVKIHNFFQNRLFIFFALLIKSSDIFGLPSGNRSPFHSDVRNKSSSFEITCENVIWVRKNPSRKSINSLCFMICVYLKLNFFVWLK